MSSEHVIHGDELPWDEHGEGEHFAVRIRRLGAAAGGRALACSLCELEPGKTAWPFHRHLVNEEAIYVLAGRATLRLGDDRVPLRAGDYVALPPDEELAHQITNTGDEPFRYLCLSTTHDPDVVHYPDSRKVGVVGGGHDTLPFGFYPEAAAVDYWHGEPVGEPAPEPDTKADDAAVEREIDEEIERLKKKLDLPPKP